jgi:hypothetical protein
MADANPIRRVDNKIGVSQCRALWARVSYKVKILVYPLFYIKEVRRMSMLSEEAKINMYGDMTEEEIKLVYRHEGNYKGWICHYTGCGRLIFEKGYKKPIEAYRGLEVNNWIPECWKECKSKIDEIESAVKEVL